VLSFNGLRLLGFIWQFLDGLSPALPAYLQNARLAAASFFSGCRVRLWLFLRPLLARGVDPTSVEMRIRALGLLPAVYDPKIKLVTYAFTQKLVPKMYIVTLTAKVNGKKVETRWDFTGDLQ
jgi:hypothetical protein